MIMFKWYSSLWKIYLKVRSVTCHMGSHSVIAATRHR